MNRPPPPPSSSTTTAASASSTAVVEVSRPRTLLDLANDARKEVNWDPTLKITYWIKQADEFRRQATAHQRAGNVERAFVEFAKSTTILEKIKGHREYLNAVDEDQRRNLNANTQRMLDMIGSLKPEIVNRYDKWAGKQPEQASQADLQRKKEAERRQAEEAAKREHVLTVKLQHERETARRKEEAERLEREAKAAREEQLRKWQSENQSVVKYSKASDSAAVLQERKREEEKKKALNSTQYYMNGGITRQKADSPVKDRDTDYRRTEKSKDSDEDMKRRALDTERRRQQEATTPQSQGHSRRTDETPPRPIQPPAPVSRESSRRAPSISPNPSSGYQKPDDDVILIDRHEGTKKSSSNPSPNPLRLSPNDAARDSGSSPARSGRGEPQSSPSRHIPADERPRESPQPPATRTSASSSAGAYAQLNGPRHTLQDDRPQITPPRPSAQNGVASYQLSTSHKQALIPEERTRESHVTPPRLTGTSSFGAHVAARQGSLNDRPHGSQSSGSRQLTSAATMPLLQTTPTRHNSVDTHSRPGMSSAGAYAQTLPRSNSLDVGGSHVRPSGVSRAGAFAQALQEEQTSRSGNESTSRTSYDHYRSAPPDIYRTDNVDTPTREASRRDAEETERRKAVEKKYKEERARVEAERSMRQRNAAGQPSPNDLLAQSRTEMEALRKTTDELELASQKREAERLREQEREADENRRRAAEEALVKQRAAEEASRREAEQAAAAAAAQRAEESAFEEQDDRSHTPARSYDPALNSESENEAGSQPFRRPQKLLSDYGDERPPMLSNSLTLHSPSNAVAGPSNYRGASISRESSPSLAPSTPQNVIDSQPILPLQSPLRWLGDDSSADESGRRKPPLPPDPTRPPRKKVLEREQASVAGPPPLTTTSERGARQIKYPDLMSPHQREQGYTPSLHSTVVPPPRTEQNGILFGPTPSTIHAQNLIPTNPWPRPPKGQSNMPVALMDRKSQEEDKRIRAADPRHDKIKAELRPVDVPKDLLKRFVAVSAANTELNIETLGLLMGKPKGGKYVVTTLLIPRQQASSDWCSMEDEETVLEFQERRFLITLGWIHTHPSQSCFMSSVDLHTHAPYQKMLPESFAIVCAPKKEPNYGVFRLTDPPGLSFILDCTASSSFHPHSQDHLYTDCDGTHVTLVEGIGLEICDIRNSFIVA